MRSLRLIREMQRRSERRAMGYGPRAPGMVSRASLRQGFEAAHLALPMEIDYLVEIQKSDGSFYFMLDYSLLDGPDTLA